MKKLITIAFCVGILISTIAQNQSPNSSEKAKDAVQVQIDSLKAEIKELKEYKKTFDLIGIPTGITIIAALGWLLWLYKIQVPKLVKEALKSKIKEELDEHKKMFSDKRLTIVSSIKKDADLANFLGDNGFKESNLQHFQLSEIQSVDLNKTDIIVINNLNNALGEAEIRKVFNQFPGQKIFYVGESRLPADLYALGMKPPANSVGTFIGNFLKALG